MEAQTTFCPNEGRPAKGQTAKGNIRIHGQKQQRYFCIKCGKTFAATKGTPFYRLHHSAALVVQVVTLLAHGCPVQAIVAACELDERTVADWQQRAAIQCQQVPEHLVAQHDSLRVRCAEDTCGWRERTPALAAAGLADHCWSVKELLWYRVPPPRWIPPKRRGRVSQAMKLTIARWCHA